MEKPEKINTSSESFDCGHNLAITDYERFLPCVAEIETIFKQCQKTGRNAAVAIAERIGKE